MDWPGDISVRRLNVSFPFPHSYEIRGLDRIRREFSGQRALAFPGGGAVDPQQELADAPIVRVDPHVGEPWLGVFYGGELASGPPRFAAELLSWPDGHSFCVVYRGLGLVVDAYAPENTQTVAAKPVTAVHAVPELGLVLFADFTSLACYDADGLVWKSERLAWDEVKIESVDVERGIIHVRGFDAPADDTQSPFTVDMTTGASSDKPYDVRD